MVALGFPAIHARAATTACATEASFDSDDFADIAVGIPGEAVGSDRDAGAVAALYGAAGGSLDRDQFWHQDTPGVAGGTEAGDAFGVAVAKGDFDGDGFGDLAVGAPDEDDGAGIVHVLYGTATGLRTTGAQRISQASGDVAGTPEAGDLFGWALAAGDLDGDDRDELAVGAPGETLGPDEQAGVVVVLQGDGGGLRTTGSDVVTQGRGGVAGAPEDYDRFGLSLEACDFDGDGNFDLAIGSDESLAGASFAGSVNVLLGPSLSGPGVVLTQTTKESGDGFGASLAAGDFDGDGRGDLAVGAPGENVGGAEDQGMIHVFMSEPEGPLREETVWHQGMGTIEGGAGAFEYFGFALAAGDHDEDGRDDLAVGVPGDHQTEGSAAILLGSASGITATGDRLVGQDTATFPGDGERGDHWASALTMADVDGDGTADLVVGAAEENIGSSVDAGSITVVFGGDIRAPSLLYQDANGILNGSERDDLFGFSLA